MAMEVLKFEDLKGNVHHYNLARVQDVVKYKEEGTCAVIVDDMGTGRPMSLEISEDEYNRINGYEQNDAKS